MPVPAYATAAGPLPSEDEIKADPRGCYCKVRARMNEILASGHAIPEGLKRVERVIEAECMAESQGR